MRRIAVAILTVLLVSWLALPVLRAYALVAGLPSRPHPPADLAVEEVSFSSDSARLSGWIVRGIEGRPAVVLAHGFKGSREDMIPWARFLHEAGYNVLLFDTRACGQSGGSVIGLGTLEAHDVAAAAHFARDRFAARRVAALGISLSAGAAILAAADDTSIDGVIADSAWTDQVFALERLGSLPVGSVQLPLPPLAIPALNVFVGEDVTKARPIDVIARIAPRPVLLIHSADDGNATTPPAGADRLYAAAGEPKRLWIAPRGGHVGAIEAFPAQYRARVLDFLGALG